MASIRPIGARSPPTSAKGDAFDRALADFSVTYADQNERDSEAFAAAVKAGRVETEPGR